MTDQYKRYIDEKLSYCFGGFKNWSQLSDCLHVHFRRTAKRVPEKIAVIDKERSLTYKELDEKSDKLAWYLQSVHNVKVDDPIGIFVSKSLEYVISYVAILKAGGAYSPIDMSYPDDMIKKLLRKVQMKVVLTFKKTVERLPEGQKYFCYDDWEKEIEAKNAEWEDFEDRNKTEPTSLAFLSFSSGSTGEPKAITVPHVSSVNSYYWRIFNYPYEEDEREGCNIFFTWEMLRPLLGGITLVIIPQEVIYNPKELCKFLEEKKVTRVLFTPSTYQAIYDIIPTEDIKSHLKFLKIIFLCGEVVKMTLYENSMRTLPKCNLVNLYSVSECHDITCGEISNLNNSTKYASTGNVMENTFFYILNDELKIVPKGEVGELYVGGITLAREYYKLRTLTKKKFIKNPFDFPKIPSEFLETYMRGGNLLYQSGDLGRIRSDGSLEILGRCNSMVKIRGYSIELAAVESFLNQYEKISSSIVTKDDKERLVAYVILLEETNGTEIRNHLKKFLPHYMIPDVIMKLDKIPVGAVAGKMNVKLLPKVDENRHLIIPLKINFQTCVNETQKKIHKIWKTLLPTMKFGVTDNFVDIGGNSILIARMYHLIKEEFPKFSKGITLGNIYENMTIEKLSILIEEKSALGKKLEEERIKKLHKEMEDDLDWDFFKKDEEEEIMENEELKEKFHPTILLTGATGYLGAFLLQFIISKFKGSKVYCLVRLEGGMNRLLKNLEKYDIKVDESNLHVLKGDFSKNLIGLKDEEEYLRICEEVDFVIHNGAEVNFVKTYSQLKHSNVNGTKNVIKFCLKKKMKPLCFVSTNGVFDRNDIYLKEEIDYSSEKACSLSLGYCQSKYIAEMLVNTAFSKKLRGFIVRPGEICGDTEKGRYNHSHDLIHQIEHFIKEGVAPKDNRLIDITPVDMVSKEIAKLSKEFIRERIENGKKYNLVNNKQIRIVDAINYLRENLDFDIKLLSTRQFLNHLKNTPDSRLYSLSPILETQFNLQDCVYETSRWSLNVLPSAQYVLLKMITRMGEKGLIKMSRKTRIFGKSAIITGSSYGIGKRIAVKLAKNGVNICIASRSEDVLKKIKEDLDLQKKEEYCNIGRVIYKKCDVTIREQVEELTNYAIKEFGKIDYFVANAGIMPATMLKNCKLDLWKNTVNVNVFGLLHSLNSIIKHFKKNKSGHFVLMSSNAGVEVWETLTVYSATKFFTEAMAKGLRKELSAKYNVKVTSIQPGDVKNTMIMRDNQNDNEGLMEFDKIICQRMLVPEDIAKSVLFALQQSDDCAVNEILIEPIY